MALITGDRENENANNDRANPHAHLPPTLWPVPTPFRRSTDGGVTYQHFLGCTICRERIEVDETEFKAVVMADLEGTLCSKCLEKIP